MKLLVLAAPSGSGKTTLVRQLLSKFPSLAFSISATTRMPRLNEKNGLDYHFLEIQDFQEKINSKCFLEWEEVYPDKFYGSLKSDVQELWDQKKTVVFDIDVQGGMRLKKKYGDNTLAIFIMPPSIEALKSRLQNRGTDSEKTINNRLAKAKEEMSFSSYFDHVIVNDKIKVAIAELDKLVQDFINS